MIYSRRLWGHMPQKGLMTSTDMKTSKILSRSTSIHPNITSTVYETPQPERSLINEDYLNLHTFTSPIIRPVMKAWRKDLIGRTTSPLWRSHELWSHPITTTSNRSISHQLRRSLKKSLQHRHLLPTGVASPWSSLWTTPSDWLLLTDLIIYTISELPTTVITIQDILHQPHLIVVE